MVAVPLLLFEFSGGVLLLLLHIAGGERGASEAACFLDKGARRCSGAVGSVGRWGLHYAAVFKGKRKVLCRCLHVSGWTMES